MLINDSKSIFDSICFNQHPPRQKVAAPVCVKEFFQAVTAALISPAQFARGLTKRGVNHGNVPIKSCVTKICPSQSGPLPLPIVGTEILSKSIVPIKAIVALDKNVWMN
jgi:hypothetical protein